ncbi:hypothetical protein Dsin_013635 [Dipteronia sinensis]|uniref:Reverse transcriptase zinc-binding domain-containing protein n=1 Tax=Dipteronia sinensis TaxID=43782 RepID=A0AAE0AL32_9ROSI|nr:hypothetical protein Dsin_013635 [Dipteronia sinensis]
MDVRDGNLTRTHGHPPEPDPIGSGLDGEFMTCKPANPFKETTGGFSFASAGLDFTKPTLTRPVAIPNGRLSLGRVVWGLFQSYGKACDWKNKNGGDVPLWKRVVCASYGVDVGALHWNWQASTTASQFVKSMGQLVIAGSKTEPLLSDGLHVNVGNGGAPVGGGSEETIVGLGGGSVASWLDAQVLEGPSLDDQEALKFFRQGICPPKVQVFGWQLVKGKVLVRNQLSRYGLDQVACLDCPLCGSNVESVDHLFIHCQWSWNLWLKCIGWWKVVGCPNFSFRLDGRLARPLPEAQEQEGMEYIVLFHCLDHMGGEKSSNF